MALWPLSPVVVVVSFLHPILFIVSSILTYGCDYTGIGLNMTRALAANGAHKIYILGRRLEVLEKAAAEFPDVIIPHQADVTTKTDLQAAVDRIKSEVGHVNLVVANSGSIGPPRTIQPCGLSA